MLIGLVRDSVMQCFCHTCRVPILPAAAGKARAVPVQKLRTKQPKSSNRINFISTEIRCQEKSKGGLCYEVILGQPAVIAPPKHSTTAPTAKNISAEEIERKLREAEERRLSLGAKKSAEWSAKINRIEEATRKKNEMSKEFSNQAKEALDAKMGNYEENREAIMMDIKEKLKSQFQEIEKTRMTLEEQKNVERIALDEKLKSAAISRDENIKKMLDRLKEHNNKKLATVRTNADAQMSQKAVEKMNVFENKLFIAEQNREKELQKKLDSIRRHDRHAEMVRQKAANNKMISSEPMMATASG